LKNDFLITAGRMKQECLRSIFVFLFTVFLFYDGSAQYEIKNGTCINTSDTTRVLVVFAEVDYSKTPCPSNLPDNIVGNWPKDKNGKTLPPSDADSYFDLDIKQGEKPKAYLTDFYHQASYGNYVLLGDYYSEVISVPCNKITVGDEGLKYISDVLNKKNNGDSTLYSFHGLPLKMFDLWTPTKAGLPKIKKPDGKIDILYIIWRNNRFIYTENTTDNSGYGIHSTNGFPIKNMKGENNAASFNAGFSAGGAFFIIIAEHLHGLFGGNNWHCANGRGLHTFLFVPACYSITGQCAAAMQTACGWDRWMMEWKNPKKELLISALDNKGKESNTELLIMNKEVRCDTFILRDFITSGDAIRIQLPHINWQKNGDVKNQYLWLENHRMNTRFDKYYTEDCADNDHGKFPVGTPGMYAYIQVGKDVKAGGNEIYEGKNDSRNALGSWLFPLTAEGNYDFYYDFDRIQAANGSLCCNWGNANIPIDISKSSPNAFTGASDLYNNLDFNKDGKLYSGDNILPGLSEVVDDSVISDCKESGDWKDAFCHATGNTKISIATNPPSTPVYTYATNYEYGTYALIKGKPASFENRIIWLNGLSVEILDENVFGNGEIKVKIRWDDYVVDKNVRWCGNIVLSPNDFDTLKPSLVLEKKKKIVLDRGTTPTFPVAKEKDSEGNWIFSDTTTLTLKKNSYTILKSGSALILEKGSRLIMEKGSKIEIEKKARIILKDDSKIISDKNAIIIKQGKTKTIITQKKKNVKVLIH